MKKKYEARPGIGDGAALDREVRVLVHAHAVLRGARDEISDPANWLCDGYYSRDAEGNPVADASSPKATRFCAVGALARSRLLYGRDNPGIERRERNDAWLEVVGTLHEELGYERDPRNQSLATLERVNDGTSHASVLKVLDGAISSVRGRVRVPSKAIETEGTGGSR